MKLETAILYFLAARYPAAFGAETVRMRVNRSGAIDGKASADDAGKALALLARRFGTVELVTDDDGSQYWSATPKGVSKWTVDGRPCVGG